MCVNLIFKTDFEHLYYTKNALLDYESIVIPSPYSSPPVELRLRLRKDW